MRDNCSDDVMTLTSASSLKVDCLNSGQEDKLVDLWQIMNNLGNVYKHAASCYTSSPTSVPLAAEL